MRSWFARTRRDGAGQASARDWVAIQLEARGIDDPAVLDAMRAVPRDQFVPQDLRKHAYDDGALPIGHGQTISQPYIVARMTVTLALPAWRERHGERPKVLDVGTGSGYQAAVLFEMGADVVSVEQDRGLADQARRTLSRLGYGVEVIVGDGSTAARDRAPFAGIIVAAASPDVPAPLADQLAPHGRLVIPLGSRSEQMITLVTRGPDGLLREPIEPAVFVPLLGEHGFADR